MKAMLTEYEQNIKTVKNILHSLRAGSKTESQQRKIEQYEDMLQDLMHSAGKLREYIGEE